MRNRGAFVCCLHNLRRLMATPRAWAVLIMLLLFLDNQLAPVRQMLRAEGMRVSLPGMLMYLLNDAQVMLMSGLLLLMLLFDVPMTDETQRYIITRTGRGAWARGNVLYILLAVFAYSALTCLGVLILLLPYLDWSGGWGSGLVAFVEEGAYEVYDSMLNYDPWLMRVYTPLGGGLLAMALHFLGLSMLGLLMCTANVAFNTRLGFLLAAAPLMLDSVADEYLPIKALYALPLSLSRLSSLDYGDEMGRPNMLYGFLALAFVCALGAWACVRLCKRREINL